MLCLAWEVKENVQAYDVRVLNTGFSRLVMGPAQAVLIGGMQISYGV